MYDRKTKKCGLESWLGVLNGVLNTPFSWSVSVIHIDMKDAHIDQKNVAPSHIFEPHSSHIFELDNVTMWLGATFKPHAHSEPHCHSSHMHTPSHVVTLSHCDKKCGSEAHCRATFKRFDVDIDTSSVHVCNYHVDVYDRNTPRHIFLKVRFWSNILSNMIEILRLCRHRQGLEQQWKS